MWMKQNNKGNNYYIIELLLHTKKFQEDIITKRLECGRCIYNALLHIVLNRYNEMTKTKIYRELYNSLTNNEKDSKVIWKQINQIRKEWRLTEFDIKNDAKLMQHHYKRHLHSRIVQNIASDVWKAISSLFYTSGKKVHFKKFGTFNSLSSNESTQGIIFDGVDTINWTGLSLKIKFPHSPKSKLYIEQNLFSNLHRLKFCRIVRKQIRGKFKYYIQFIFEGESVSSRYTLGKGKVGIDIGTSTIAVSSNTDVFIHELANGVLELEREKKQIQRKMDRSRRATNLNKYNKDGTIKKNNKEPWNNSNRYRKLQKQYRELCRKQVVLRRLQHGKLSNYILSLGNEFYVEEMNFVALARRSKKPIEYKKDGKYKRKKRFGKSIGNRAPSLLLTLINNKLKYSNKILQKVNTQKCKASQFNHITQTYVKKPLSQRWNLINNIPVQRDLYSAFLISNVNETLDSFNIELCNQKYNNFLNLHNLEIQKLEQEKLTTHKQFLSCIGI
jgi:hypothetical protein